MVSAIDASTPWGAPTIPTIDPGLVTANDVATDCPVPTHCLALAAIDAVVAESAAIDALRGDPRPAVRARAVAIDERRDDEVALRDASHLGTHLFYNASELVADCTEIVGRLTAVVPEVRAADARQHDPDDGVCGRRYHGVGTLADLDRVRSLEDCSAQWLHLLDWRRRVLSVADMVAPGGAVAFVVHVQHRDVSHEARRRGAMPVVLARLEEHAVARANDLDRPTATLREADAFGDEDGLAVGVRVPRGAGARREVDAARGEARRIGRRP